ncbi:hypothetical protein AB0L22_28130 [Micromonospora haikouensis]|uniref:hypothetical protein n=1 Tax=Micromonospora haikouensis TaxID=686309 RepID=UPI0034296148
MTPSWLTTAMDWLPHLTILLAFLTALIRFTLVIPRLWRRLRSLRARRRASAQPTRSASGATGHAP